MQRWALMPLLVLLAGCGSGDTPSTPSASVPSPVPTPTPAATPTPSAASAYAGNWAYRTTLTAVDRNCGHTAADVGAEEGPFDVTIASNGTFALPGGSVGSVNSNGDVTLTLAATGGSCGAGSGAG